MVTGKAFLGVVGVWIQYPFRFLSPLNAHEGFCKGETSKPSRFCKVSQVKVSVSRVRLFMTPWTRQAPLYMEFSRQEYWVTLESPLDCKEIQPVHPKDQSWVFIGRTDADPILWPPHVKN